MPFESRSVGAANGAGLAKWRPKLLALFGGCFLLAGGTAILSARALRGPVLLVDQPVRQLPPSKGDRRTPHVVFRIANGGNQRLVIDRITTSCGCAVVKSPKETLEPGEESALEVTAVRPAVGNPATVTVTIKSNCRVEPTKELRITGLAERTAPYVFSHSARVHVTDAAPGVTQEFWIRTLEKEREPPWLTGATCTLPFVDIRVMGEKSQPFRAGHVERYYSFTATLGSVPYPGDYHGVVTIAQSPEFRLPIDVQVPHPLRASPAALFARISSDESPRQFRLAIRSADGEPIDGVTATAAPADRIHLEAVASGGDPEFLVSITGPVTDVPVVGEILVRQAKSAVPLRVPVAVSGATSESRR